MSGFVKFIRTCFSSPTVKSTIDRTPSQEYQELASIEKRIQNLIDDISQMSRELKLDYLTEAILSLRKLMLQVRRMRNGSMETTDERMTAIVKNLYRYRFVVVHCHLMLYQEHLSESPILAEKVQELQSTTWMKLSQANYQFTNEETETAERDVMYVKNYVQTRKSQKKTVKAVDEGEKSLALLQQLVILIKALENGYHVPPTLGRPRECCFNDVKTLRRQFHKLQKISRRGSNTESIDDIEKIIAIIGHHIRPDPNRVTLDSSEIKPFKTSVGDLDFDESLI
ncbi:DgyrCDS13608 [Dimorphilus gyrociliatus]|uniref:DgyrCDS13608 n=1 Tax=Dimorphilus gyrociliatus TaxID=2664684 RepID=A0A7I8WB59_9ANNE|nr:DgyrCDS13608 [Dimorphilus gyrociliatus]